MAASVLSEAYAALVVWYRAHISDLSNNPSLSPDYTQDAVRFINRLPEESDAVDSERRLVCEETRSGLLEWGYVAENSLGRNGEVAQRALEGSGGPLRPGEWEELSFRSTLFSCLPQGQAEALLRDAAPVAEKLNDAVSRANIALATATIALQMHRRTEVPPLVELAGSLAQKFGDDTRRAIQAQITVLREAMASTAQAMAPNPNVASSTAPPAEEEPEFSAGAESIVEGASGRAIPPGGLTTSALILIELVEKGERNGPYTSWSADFIAQALVAAKADFEGIRDLYLRDYLPQAQPKDALSVTPGLYYAIQRAEELARQTTGNRRVSARHVLAVLIMEPPEPHHLGSVEFLRNAGLDLAVLRGQFFEWVRGYGDNDQAWRLFLLKAASAPRRLADFNADNTQGPDLLGIEQDVTALGALIAARTLAPPLSIGLFGEWGSGKTFFMGQLQTMVASLSKDARESCRAQKELPFFKHVVQIVFNAWHYVEGNLWASLVEHIFRNLRQTDSTTRDSVEAMQKHWIEQLGFKETAQLAAEARATDAKNQVESAEKNLQRVQREHAEKTAELQRLSAKSVAHDFRLAGAQRVVEKALEPLGLKAVSDAANDLKSSLREARSVVEGGNAFLTPLVHAKDRASRFRSLLFVLLGAPAAAMAIGWALSAMGQVEIGKIMAAATGAATLLTTGANWVRKQAKWMSERLAEVENANKTYDQALAVEQGETEKARALMQQELELKRQDYAAAQRTAEQARLEYAEMKKQAAEATPGKLLGKFIEDRAASSDYRKHLGVLAVVRDDFEELSKLIERENARLNELPSLDAEEVSANTRVNRIVLYIDDLDRCPPNKVIEVLQAVHLLLAFPLFVVVVGVDARWISRSLETRYRELLHAEGAENGAGANDMYGVLRSNDYLEKIFQIPLWLRPMDRTAVSRMIEGMAGRATVKAVPRAPAAAQTAAPAPGSVATPAASPAPAAVQANPAASPVASPVPAAPASPAPSVAAAPPVANAESLEIRGFEIEMMDDLATLLGRSPRALKRFFNVYRLIKAGLGEAELGAFLRMDEKTMSSFQAVQFLLAVDTGLPRLSRDLLDLLQRGIPLAGDDIGTLTKALANTLGNMPDWPRLAGWLTQRQTDTPTQSVIPAITEWAPRVARYSFQAAPLD